MRGFYNKDATFVPFKYSIYSVKRQKQVILRVLAQLHRPV